MAEYQLHFMVDLVVGSTVICTIQFTVVCAVISAGVAAVVYTVMFVIIVAVTSAVMTAVLFAVDFESVFVPISTVDLAEFSVIVALEMAINTVLNLQPDIAHNTLQPHLKPGEQRTTSHFLVPSLFKKHPDPWLIAIVLVHVVERAFPAVFLGLAFPEIVLAEKAVIL